MLHAEQKIESLILNTSRTRIVEFLRDLAKERGKRLGDEVLVNGFFTHQEIANMTATCRQSVTTILNDLRRKNILIFNKKRLLIRSIENLLNEAD